MRQALSACFHGRDGGVFTRMGVGESWCPMEFSFSHGRFQYHNQERWTEFNGTLAKKSRHFLVGTVDGA